jgi:hypothetical protein
VERSLANQCFDILGEVQRESLFYDALRNVYQDVVDADPEADHEEVRKRCAKGFEEVFQHAPYIIRGDENLPSSQSGLIFIYNHLRNHPFNTLPNNFQLTLDSHFISAMIVNKHYGRPGIRVVRVSREVEFGNQYYYNRLGHINVHTSESDILEESPEQKKARRDAFYKSALSELESGNHLIISPEGTSYETHESPGLFKPGAFRLAAMAKKEPYIVPIAVANFDKRVNRTVFSVIIKEPFKISEKVSNPNNKEEMKSFLKSYSQTFKGYVQQAVETGKSYRQEIVRDRLGLDHGPEKIIVENT